MAFLNFIYRNGLWLSVPVFAAAAALLVFFIMSLVRLNSRAQLASLPLVEQQTVDFAEAGRVLLSLEGPRLSKRFDELRFTLVSPDAAAVPGSKDWILAHTSGASTVSMELMSFILDRPGRYELRTANLGAPRGDDGLHKIILSRPHLPEMVGLGLGITFSAGLLIGSLVLFILRLTSAGDAP